MLCRLLSLEFLHQICFSIPSKISSLIRTKNQPNEFRTLPSHATIRCWPLHKLSCTFRPNQNLLVDENKNLRISNVFFVQRLTLRKYFWFFISFQANLDNWECLTKCSNMCFPEGQIFSNAEAWESFASSSFSKKRGRKVRSTAFNVSRCQVKLFLVIKHESVLSWWNRITIKKWTKPIGFQAISENVGTSQPP